MLGLCIKVESRLGIQFGDTFFLFFSFDRMNAIF